MTRLPRLLDPGSPHVLALTILAAMSCGGQVDSSGGAGGGPTQPSSSSSSSGGGSGLTCADPIHVSIGETVGGSTCGGESLSSGICFPDTAAAFFYVDAPSGAVFSIAVTPAVAWGAYVDCADGPRECSGGNTSIPPIPNTQLFRVQMPGQGPCGNFTVTVVGQ